MIQKVLDVLRRERLRTRDHSVHISVIESRNNVDCMEVLTFRRSHHEIDESKNVPLIGYAAQELDFAKDSLCVD